ncbi:FliH/SctL family protein [Clostridioides difficile]
MILLNNKIIKSKKASYKGVLDLSIIDKARTGESNVNEASDCRFRDEVIKEAIESAEIKKNEILEKAKINAQNIEKQAYEKGYRQGQKNGYEDGYKESYDEYTQKAKDESDFIKNQANLILLQANDKMTEYIKEKNKEIVRLAINMASSALKKHFEDEESMSDLLRQIIQDYEGSSSFIVKCNSFYKENIEKEFELLKKETSLKSNVFVIADDSIDKGNAIIQKENGRIIVGIDCAIEKLKEELLGE